MPHWRLPQFLPGLDGIAESLDDVRYTGQPTLKAEGEPAYVDNSEIKGVTRRSQSINSPGQVKVSICELTPLAAGILFFLV